MKIAAIDIGTITTRLLIVEVGGEGTLSGSVPAEAFSHANVTEIFRSVDITNLGEGLEKTGQKLSALAIQRVVDICVEYLVRIEYVGVDRVIAVATSAARDAENRDIFLRRITELGIPLRIIDGTEEARFSFLGTTMGMTGNILVADVGGGSTELVEGEAGKEFSFASSYAVGARRLTNVLLRHDPPTQPEIAAARGAAREMIRPFFEEESLTYDKMVCVGGTATSLSAIQQKLDPYDPAKVHLSVLSRKQLADLITKLAAMDVATREHVVGLEPKRAPIIVGGALILDELLGLSGQNELTVSENDLLYGLVVDAYNT